MKDMTTILVIARREFSDRLRSGWVFACVVVWLGAITLTSLFGLVQIGRVGLLGYERTVVSLLNLVQYLVPLLGLLIGHDLIAGEREDRTLALVVAAGVRRVHLVVGKYLGGALTLGLPLVLGFAIAGVVIGLSTGVRALGAFLQLAASGLGLGLLFVGVGLSISSWCRARVQAVVLTLLSWCLVVFVFDLVALGLVVAAHADHAHQEIQTATGATHVNAMARMHAAFAGEARGGVPPSAPRATAPSLPCWLLLNPLDLFRVLNLPRALAPVVPVLPAVGSVVLWLGAALGTSVWRLRRIDL